MAKPYHIISITGHRPDKLGGYGPNLITHQVEEEIVYHFHTRVQQLPDKQVGVVWGGALGADQLAAYKANCFFYGDYGPTKLPHALVLPFKGLQRKWPIRSQEWYMGLANTTNHDLAVEVKNRCNLFDLTMAKEDLGVLLVHNDDRYSAQRMQDRNMAMVDVADEVLAIWDGSNGGTANCVGYTKHVNKPITIINPKEAGK